ncbi:unnamed protein product [Polarella glacialis]|uniref:Uncharacterized protein n=1 Tax=Polarella glacialis TaxID=89957 RepID=A0A813KU60_POLGL|nr:unnamed protein product [Polarella glacialis]
MVLVCQSLLYSSKQGTVFNKQLYDRWFKPAAEHLACLRSSRKPAPMLQLQVLPVKPLRGLACRSTRVKLGELLRSVPGAMFPRFVQHKYQATNMRQFPSCVQAPHPESHA